MLQSHTCKIVCNGHLMKRDISSNRGLINIWAIYWSNFPEKYTLLSLVNLVIFLPLGGTSSILRTFLGGTSKKTHHVCQVVHPAPVH